MEVKITKHQEVIDGVEQEAVYHLELTRKYMAKWRNNTIEYLKLYEDELLDVREAIEEKLRPKETTAIQGRWWSSSYPSCNCGAITGKKQPIPQILPKSQ